MIRTVLLLIAATTASAFTVPSAAPARSSVSMMAGKSNNTPAKLVPKGPFGNYAKVGEKTGWLGDDSKSEQISKFESGADYLFFQGPAPKTAVQEDLPSFFSPDNFADLEIKPLQILVTITGFGSAAALAGLLLA